MNKVWQEYPIVYDSKTKKGLFQIEVGKDMLGAKKHLISSNSKHDKVCVVSNTLANNGIIDEIKNTKTKHKNVLTLATRGNDCKCFYHKNYYVLPVIGAICLSPVGFVLNEYIALFLSTLLYRQAFKYSYGRFLSGKRIAKESLFLPSKNEKPDWHFMQRYIQSLSKKIDFSSAIINIKNIKGRTEMISSAKWQNFKLANIFQITRGKRLLLINRQKGAVPYYSAREYENGLSDFIANPLFIEKDCLLYTTFGKAYYVKGEFTASDEVNILKNDNMNEYSGLFIATILNQSRGQFSFGRKAFAKKVREFEIKLPVDGRGCVDWQFMENYIKTLPYSCYIE